MPYSFLLYYPCNVCAAICNKVMYDWTHLSHADAAWYAVSDPVFLRARFSAPGRGKTLTSPRSRCKCVFTHLTCSTSTESLWFASRYEKGASSYCPASTPSRGSLCSPSLAILTTLRRSQNFWRSRSKAGICNVFKDNFVTLIQPHGCGLWITETY